MHHLTFTRCRLSYLFCYIPPRHGPHHPRHRRRGNTHRPPLPPHLQAARAKTQILPRQHPCSPLPLGPVHLLPDLLPRCDHPTNLPFPSPPPHYPIPKHLSLPPPLPPAPTISRASLGRPHKMARFLPLRPRPPPRLAPLPARKIRPRRANWPQ